MKNKITLADEISENNPSIKEALKIQENIDLLETPQVEELTIESIEQFFISEGQWIEGQLVAEIGKYKNCPICTIMPEVLKSLSGALEDTLKNIDEMIDEIEFMRLDQETVLENIKRERAWYLIAKEIAMTLFEQGHGARNVINAHPELYSMASAKKHKKRSEKKDKRKAQRIARRNNR